MCSATCDHNPSSIAMYLNRFCFPQSLQYGTLLMTQDGCLKSNLHVLCQPAKWKKVWKRHTFGIVSEGNHLHLLNQTLPWAYTEHQRRKEYVIFYLAAMYQDKNWFCYCYYFFREVLLNFIWAKEHIPGSNISTDWKKKIDSSSVIKCKGKMDMVVYYSKWYMDLYPVFLRSFMLKQIHALSFVPIKRGPAQARFLYHMPSWFRIHCHGLVLPRESRPTISASGVFHHQIKYNEKASRLFLSAFNNLTRFVFQNLLWKWDASQDKVDGDECPRELSRVF